jgi:hypothetical protein
MTPLEEYAQAVNKAGDIRRESVERAERLHLMKVKHAKNMLKIDQENCDHKDFRENVVKNYHRRVEEVTLTCKNCGVIK